MTIGIYTNPFISFFNGKLNLYKPIADIVPMIVDTIVEVKAIIKVFINASNKSVLENNSLYHLKVKPVNIIFISDLLNEYSTSTIIGAYRNINVRTIIKFLINLFFFIYIPPKSSI